MCMILRSSLWRNCQHLLRTSLLSKPLDHLKIIWKLRMETKELNTSISSSANNDSFNQSLRSPIIFYGVNVLNSSNIDTTYGGSPLVFTERSEALQVMKKEKGARFKGFGTIEEAVTFSMQHNLSTPDKSLHDNSTDNAFNLVSNLEKNSSFKSLKSQETVKFRKFIEAGNIEAFIELAWTNPRYLISAGDTPKVLQEGFHYNALHVAAKSNQVELLKIILTTIQDDKFLKLLFEFDSEEIFNQRKKFIIDLYLNLPEKGMCETPLHFACKFGFLKAVEVLLSHPSCDRTRVNKNGKTAREIICDRSGDANLKKQIDNLFEAQYFIPVLRSEGNSIQPIIGKPFAINDPTTVIRNKDLPDPVSALLVIKAKAGPMPLSKVNEFYKKWKHPTHVGSPAKLVFPQKASLNSSIRLSDSDKGLERIGRQIAKELDVPWTEFWPFMDSWCDITSEEGLTKLEQHLSEMRKIKTAEIEAINNLSLLSESYANSPLNQSLSPMTLICQKLENFHLHSTPQSNSTKLNRNVSRTSQLYASPVLSESKTEQCGLMSDIVTKLNFDNEPNVSTNNEPKLNIENCNCQIVEKLSNFFVDFMIDVENGFKSFESLMQLTKSSLEILMNTALQQNVHKQLSTVHKNVAVNLLSSLKENMSNQNLKSICYLCKNMLEQDMDSSTEEYGVETNSPSKTYNRRSVVVIKDDRSFLQEHLRCILKYFVKIVAENDSFQGYHCQCSKDNDGNYFVDHDGSDDSRSIQSKASESNEISGSESNEISGRESNEISGSESNEISGSESDNEMYVTPPSSSNSSSMDMPDEIIDIFIQGLTPSKADMDVLHALDGIDIDPFQFPAVKLWMHCLNCYPKEAHKMWESPALTKIRNNNGQPSSAPSKFSSLVSESAARSFISRFKVQKGAYSTPIQRLTFNLEEKDNPINFNDSLNNMSF